MTYEEMWDKDEDGLSLFWTTDHRDIMVHWEQKTDRFRISIFKDGYFLASWWEEANDEICNAMPIYNGLREWVLNRLVTWVLASGGGMIS